MVKLKLIRLRTYLRRKYGIGSIFPRGFYSLAVAEQVVVARKLLEDKGHPVLHASEMNTWVNRNQAAIKLVAQ